MREFDKVVNSSNYWCDFESELSIYYHLKWIGEHSINKFISNEMIFFTKYISLCKKYGFAIPLNCNEDNFFDLYQQEINKKKGYDMSAWYLMFRMYTYGKELVYPSKLFIDIKDISFKNIVNIDPISELKHLEVDNVSFAPPLIIELREKQDEIVLTCYIDNDIFNLELDNKKCHDLDYFVDNSGLAYLNTPRFNSFLRDLKKLCFEYCATDFEFENLGLKDFCEDGVMFNGEVVYYEDIENLLEPHQRIPSLFQV